MTKTSACSIFELGLMDVETFSTVEFKLSASRKTSPPIEEISLHVGELGGISRWYWPKEIRELGLGGMWALWQMDVETEYLTAPPYQFCQKCSFSAVWDNTAHWLPQQTDLIGLLFQFSQLPGLGWISSAIRRLSNYCLLNPMPTFFPCRHHLICWGPPLLIENFSSHCQQTYWL